MQTVEICVCYHTAAFGFVLSSAVTCMVLIAGAVLLSISYTNLFNR